MAFTRRQEKLWVRIRAIFPFPGEAARHKNGPMLHRKFMWQDHSNPHSANSLNKLAYRKKAENLLVGKTKSYGSCPLLVMCLCGISDDSSLLYLKHP